jgi:alginate O-acetyltransferase complex protein AlgI
MSAGFHFGILRLLTAFWRMQGFPVRVLFRNPLKMRGFRDFWSKRWNLAYSHMMARAVKKPLTPLLGENGSVFAVFVVSGLLHELAITVPVGAGYGWPTLFFLLHGVICFFEKRDSVLMGVLCGVVLILGVPFLFGERFVEEIILPSRNVIEYFN